jgi:ATP-dependent exoDNAse (exonuclease V) alpha subunit
MTRIGAKALNKPLLIVGVDRKLAGLAFIFSVIIGANDGGSKRAQAAVQFARERLGERSAAFEHFEVIRDALRHAQGKIRLPEIQAELNRQLAEGRFQKVDHIRPHAPAARYTTPKLVQPERDAIERVRAGIGQAKPIVSITSAEIEQRYGGKLNEDQQRLVFDTVVSRDQISGIQGGAGTGKTTSLRAIKEVAEEGGYHPVGLGPTSRAAKGLKEAGMEAETLQAFLLRSSQPSEDTRRRLFFVDESSLASGRQMRDFLERLQPQDRVLLVGDIRQHQSVEAGRIFDELQRAGMNTASLSKIVRQKDEALRTAVEAMACGQVEKGVELLAGQNRIQSIEHRGERFRAIRGIARRHAGSLAGQQLPARAERGDPGRVARFRKAGRGRLLPVLINRQEITGEDRKLAASYRVGDSVRYTRGSDALGLEAKSYDTVIQVDAESNQVTVQKADRTLVTYDPSRVKGVALYTPESRAFAQGERVQFTAPWKEKAISGRDFGTVIRVDEHGHLSVKLDDSNRIVSWNLKDNKHIDYAYAMTSHSSQGATVDRVLIHIDTGDSPIRGLIDQTLAYVATSRPRYDAQIFTDNADHLAAALSRRQENATALSPDQISAYSFSV